MDKFSENAKIWDTPERQERANAIAEKIASVIDFQPHAHALEFGAGTGLVGFQLIHHFEKLWFLDPAEGMCHVINEKIASQHLKNAEVIFGEMDVFTKGKEKVNYIFTSMVLHHVHDLAEVIEQWWQVLHYGGEIAIVDLHGGGESFHGKGSHVHGLDTQTLEEELKKCGFLIQFSEVFYHANRIIEGEEVPYELFILKAKKPNVESGTCPLCGEENKCAIVAGKDPQSCWCMTTSISKDVLNQIPKSQRKKSCVCARCAQK